MTSTLQLPVLPQGFSSILSSLSETFSFHSSPEAFITSRVLAFRSSNSSVAESRTPIRARVLNRNVAIISSYRHVRQILCEYSDADCPFSAAKAYDELMASFFQPPNLLLSEPPSHGPMRQLWDARMDELATNSRKRLQQTVQAHLQDINSGTTVDLYENMKKLSWKVLLSVFLKGNTPLPGDLNREDRGKVENLQEDLLRGQFSLFPVSINSRLWRSPRSKGLQARKQLQSLFRDYLRQAPNSCPFSSNSVESQEDIANHLLLFTSSLAAKALASFLTALLLNIYLYQGPHSADRTLADKLTTMTSDTDRHELLRSVYLETERLSPPVVGIMRRTTRDVVLKPSRVSSHEQSTLIPCGWDVWLYFVGASRDPAVFGPTEQIFVPERYFSSQSNFTEEGEQGFAYGAGSKSCLGKGLMREVAMNTVKAYLGILPEVEHQERTVLNLNAKEIPLGVQGWLGWQSDVKPEQWAKDMKQLPTQRPVKAINVRATRHLIRTQSPEESELEWFDAQEYLADHRDTGAEH